MDYSYQFVGLRVMDNGSRRFGHAVRFAGSRLVPPQTTQRFTDMPDIRRIYCRMDTVAA